LLLPCPCDEPSFIMPLTSNNLMFQVSKHTYFLFNSDSALVRMKL
jgi:hypothetical protein